MCPYAVIIAFNYRSVNNQNPNNSAKFPSRYAPHSILTNTAYINIIVPVRSLHLLTCNLRKVNGIITYCVLYSEYFYNSVIERDD